MPIYPFPNPISPGFLQNRKKRIEPSRPPLAFFFSPQKQLRLKKNLQCFSLFGVRLYKKFERRNKLEGIYCTFTLGEESISTRTR